MIPFLSFLFGLDSRESSLSSSIPERSAVLVWTQEHSSKIYFVPVGTSIKNKKEAGVVVYVIQYGFVSYLCVLHRVNRCVRLGRLVVFNMGSTTA